MKLCIANCSQQMQTINFRVPESPKLITHTIISGQQIYAVGPTADLSNHAVNTIVEQLAVYGMRRVQELNGVMGMVPLICSETPIKADVIRKVVDHNSGVLMARGKKLRLDAAIAASAGIENIAQNIRDDQGNQIPAEVMNTDISIEEVTSGSFTGQREPIGEGFRMDKTAATAGDGGRGKRGGKRKAA